MTNPKGAIYARFSRQDAGSEKMERQLEMCRNLAKRDGIDVVAEFQEFESGGKSERLEYRELLKLIEAGVVTHVLCQDQDRLTRSPGEWPNLRKMFRRYRIVMVTSSESVDFGAKDYRTTQKLVGAIKAASAQHMVDSAAVKRQQANVMKAREGKRYCSQAPYGYIWVAPVLKLGNIVTPGRYETIPEEYPFVEEIFRRIFNEGLPTIVADFNDRLNVTGAPIPPGMNRRRDASPVWGTSSLHRILKNPFYAGLPTMRQNVETDDDETLRTHLARQDWVHPVEALDYPHPIDIEKWEIIQALMASRNREGHRTGGVASPMLLSGILHCSNGRPMRSSGHKDYNCDCDLRGQPHAGSYIDGSLIDWIGFDILAYMTMLFNSPAETLETFFVHDRPDTEQSAYSAAYEAVRKAQGELDSIRKSESVLKSLGVFDQAIRKAEADLVERKKIEQDLRAEVEAFTTTQAQEAAVTWIRHHLSTHDNPNEEVLSKVPIDVLRNLIKMVVSRIELLATEKWSKKGRSVRLMPSEWQEYRCRTPYKGEFQQDGDGACIIAVSKTHYNTLKKERGETARNTYICSCGCGATVSIVPSKDTSVNHFASNECYAKWRKANKERKRKELG
jgi:DNA invertase Pin-like site-specific DNA recombinase